MIYNLKDQITISVLLTSVLNKGSSQVGCENPSNKCLFARDGMQINRIAINFNKTDYIKMK